MLKSISILFTPYIVLLLTTIAITFQTYAKAKPSLYLENENATVKFHQGNPRKIKLNSSLLGDYPVVNVTINGASGFKLLLDTGANTFALFNTDKVSALKLKTDDKFLLSGAGKGRVFASIGTAVVLDFGEMALEGLRPIILPVKNSPFVADSASAPFDGAIGWELLSRFVWSVSDGGKTFELIPHQVLHSKSDYFIKELELKSRQLLVDLDIKPSNSSDIFQIQATLDTGSNGILTVDSQQYPDISKARQGGYISTGHITGRSVAQQTQVKSLKLGKFEFLDVVVAQENNSTLLGSTLLNRFDYMIDLSNRELGLKSRHTTFNTFPSGTFHTGIRPTKNGNCEVVAAIENGVAWQAGLRDGMLITKLDGVINDRDKNPCNWHSIFSRKINTGDKVEVCYLTPDENEQCVWLTAQDKMLTFETDTANHTSNNVMLAKTKDYQLFTSKNGEIVFKGKLNDKSVDDVVRYLTSIGAKNSKLVIKSSGGKPLAAIKLGKFIHEYNISLHVYQLCALECLYFILPASPKVTFAENAIVVMHKTPSQLYFRMLEVFFSDERTKNNAAISEEKRLSYLKKINTQKQAILPVIEAYYSELGLSKNALSHVTKLHNAVKKSLRKDEQSKDVISEAAMMPSLAFLEKCLGYNVSGWPEYSQAKLDKLAKKASKPLVYLSDNKFIFHGRVIDEYGYDGCG